MIEGHEIDIGEIAPGAPNRPIFGVVFELNGVPVPIYSDSIDPKTGFTFKSPEPVHLGTPEDFLTWMDRSFGTDLQKTLDPSNLPTPIAQVVDTLLNADLSVYPASINVPPKDSSDSVTYAIGLVAKFPGGGLPVIPGSDLLLAASVDLNVTNKPTPGEPTPGANP